MLRQDQNQTPGSLPGIVAEQEYLHTVVSAVIVPAAQAGVTGFLLSVIILGGCLLADADWDVALLVWLIAWAVITTLVWLGLQGHWLLLTMEKLFQRKVATAPAGTKVAPTRRSITLDMRKIDENGRLSGDMESLEFEVGDDQLTPFLCGLAMKKPLSVRTWAQGKAALFSPEEYEGVIDVMLRKKWVELKNPKYPKQGYRLTPVGELAVAAEQKRVMG